MNSSAASVAALLRINHRGTGESTNGLRIVCQSWFIFNS
jgi:hypothetical protein